MRRDFSVFTIAGLIVVLILSAVNASADFISFTPDDEKYLAISGDDVVLGPFSSNRGMLVAKLDGLQSDEPTLSVETQGFFEFDLSTLQSATINSASFQFKLLATPDNVSFFDLRASPSLTSFQVFSYAGDGVVSAADFNSGALVTTIDPLPAIDSLITFDATTFINELLGDVSLFAGFGLRAGSLDGGNYFSEGLLSIDYDFNSASAPVPEPSTILLLGSGLAGLAFYRRKRK